MLAVDAFINKRKVLNDPVYGFISIPDRLIFDLIEHPYFQRLRRISQLGLSYLVYPGAHHHRFHHAMGAAHLMTLALDSLEIKGHAISPEERSAATAAILLHDIGHGPFSHALEMDLLKNVHHEDLSLLFMQRINEEFGGELDLCIEIFTKKYPRKFLSQLVSSQLDVDRLDYLKRDSFYTGVSEGVVGSQRIIKMLDLHDDELVVEQKGIYSIEKFLVARRLMYWQVYLHKTVVAAEFLLVSIIRRAKDLTAKGHVLFASPALQYFLQHDVGIEDFRSGEALEKFAQLDDYDVLGAIKVWADTEERTLSRLCKMLIHRRLPKIIISKEPPTEEKIQEYVSYTGREFLCSREEAEYFVMSGKLVNSAYDQEEENIRIKYKDGSLKDVAEASDNFNLSALSKPVEKYFLMVPGR
ncbi:MAG: HD domain-containing protein [Flavobacteriales bacterium]|nr:HD domain-containing protein [Flavobacteriales bacterium]